MNVIVKKANAKINLFLSVGGIREDGKHFVETVLQKIDLSDTVTVKVRKDRPINVLSDSPDTPSGVDNLAYKAAKLYLDEAGLSYGADIFIEKRIPVKAGLGGGSSDAAAVLLALEEYFSVLGFDRIERIGRKLGSDVPFFLYGFPTMLGTEDGSVLSEFPTLQTNIYCVLISAFEKESTGAMYANLDNIRESSSGLKRCDTLRNATETEDIKKFFENTLNDFEVCYRDYEMVKQKLMLKGCEKVLLCGSGPTVCGLCTDREKAERIKSDSDFPAAMAAFIR